MAVGGENEVQPHDELYIHHGDITSNFMLSTQKLNGDNFAEWKRSAEISLSAKNKLGFVKGTCVKPAAGSSLLSYWERCNNVVISWILHSVEPEIGRSVLYYETAAEIWKELEERYDQSNAPRKYQVHKHIGSISQGNSSVTAFYTELKTSWDEYMSLISLPVCTCGATAGFLAILQEQQLLDFLLGLNEDFKPIRGNLLMMKPLPSLSQAYRLVLQEEKQMECSNVVSFNGDSAALAAQKNFGNRFQQGNKSFGNKWNNSGGSGAQNSGNGVVVNSQGVAFGLTPSGKRSRFFCDNCKVYGHSIDRCFKIHGFPKDKGKRGANCVQVECNETGQSTGLQATMATNNSPAMLTSDQYNQLISLLNQHHLDANDSGGTGPETPSAFLAVDRRGRMAVIDMTTFELLEVVAPMEDCNGQYTYLVESNFRLYLVNKVVSSTIENVYDEDEEEWVHRTSVEKPTAFKVFVFNEKERGWDKVESLGDRVFFVTRDAAFSVRAADLGWSKGNCIYFEGLTGYDDEADMGFGLNAGVYSLEDQVISTFTSLADPRTKIFWPPSSWFVRGEDYPECEMVDQGAVC